MEKTFSEIKFLLKHSSIYGLGTVIGQAVSFILLPLYTRYLTPKDYGILELIDVTTGLIAILAGINIAAAMTRFYFEFESKEDRNRVVSTTYSITFCISIISVFILANFTKFFGELILDSSSYGCLFLLSFMGLGIGLILDIGFLYLRILQKSHIYILISLVRMVIQVGLNIFFVVYLEYGVAGILYSSIITNLFFGIFVTANVLSRVGLGFSWKLTKDMVKFSLPLIPATLATFFVNYSDRYFIKHFVSIADAGIYGLANKFATSIHMLITSPFILTFLPRRFEIVEKQNANEIFRAVFNYYYLTILSFGFVLSVFVDEIIIVMTTDKFYAAAGLVPFLVFAIIIFGMKYHFEFGILYSKKTQYYSYINIFTGCTQVIFNLILVKNYGVWGAIYSYIIATCLNTSLIYLVGNHFYRIDFEFSKNFKILCVAAILYLLSLYHFHDSLLIHVLYKASIVMAFPFLLISLGLIQRTELRKVKEICLNAYLRVKPLKEK